MSEPGSGTANYLFRRPQKLSGVARNLLYDSERAVGKRTHVPGTYVQPVTACDTVAYNKGKHAHRHPIRCFLENHNRSLPGCYYLDGASVSSLSANTKCYSQCYVRAGAAVSSPKCAGVLP